MDVSPSGDDDKHDDEGDDCGEGDDSIVGAVEVAGGILDLAGCWCLNRRHYPYNCSIPCTE